MCTGPGWCVPAMRAMGRARGDKIRHRGDVGGPWGHAARARGRNGTKTFAGEWFTGRSPAAEDPQGEPGKPNRPGGRAPTGNAARQADERGADARLGGRNPCRRPAPRAMSLPRKAETHATTTRRTPPNRKTPVGARPSGRCRCQEVCGRRAQEGRRWSGRWRYHRGWTIAARPGGADCKGSKKNHENSRMRYHSFTNPATR